MTIIGNRPQAMKVDTSLKQYLVWTGQHHDKNMKDIFLRELGIKLDYDLSRRNYNPKNTGSYKLMLLGEMIDACVNVIGRANPTHVMVYGDTNSTLAGAIAAKQCGKKLIHVEAGCRSYNMEMKEEQNRRMVDQISDVLLCPSERAMDILNEEKVMGEIGLCGNVMLDTCFAQLPTDEKILKKYKLKKKKYLLLTMHRAETVDDKQALEEVVEALGDITKPILFPMHPRTKKRLEEFKISLPDNVQVIEPVGYKEMINLIGFAEKVLTDSGGIQ